MRRVYLSAASLLVLLVGSSLALGQDSWPAYTLDGFNITRGAGSYLSTWKLSAIWMLYLAWIWTTDWVNRDAQILQLDHQKWNPINFFPFYLVLLIVTLSVAFPIGYSAGVLAWAVPIIMYVLHRNANVEDSEKVLTPDHFRHIFSSKTGVKTEKKAAHEKGAPVTFSPTSGESSAKNEANLIFARQSRELRGRERSHCRRHGSAQRQNHAGHGRRTSRRSVSD